jgi:multidrug resistance efflux pump
MGNFKAKRGIVRASLALGVLGAASLVVFFLYRGPAAKASAEPGEQLPGEMNSISVKTVRPRPDPKFQMTVSRPADVEAYYRAEIEARVPGEVKTIRVAPGSQVEKDQQLVRISIPDLEALEREKANMVGQRQQELELAKAREKAARIGIETALANVQEKKTLLQKAKADTEFRDIQFKRMQYLLTKNSIDERLRDEAAKELEVARAAEVSADASRIKAECEVSDARANVEVTTAEVERMKQVIEVAKSEHEAAKAIVEYSIVKAPFRGTVVERAVDPGSFVQNASTGHPTPLLTLERTDIVTVVMRVPDNYAPFVTAGTEAIIELDALPGVQIQGKVTRFAPSLVTASHDRTMRVEVDLWNGTPEELKQFIADPKNLTELKDGPQPLLPKLSGNDPLHRATRMMAGMYGRMSLVLKTFGAIELVPSAAILRHGGRTYIYVVEDGKAHMMPVEIQIDDGNLAKVERLDANGNVLGDLTGKEEVIITNQEELTEGQTVKVVPVENNAARNDQNGPR